MKRNALWRRVPICALFVLGTASLFVQSEAWARQSQWLVHVLNEDCVTGLARSMSGTFKVRNITDQTLELNLEPLRNKAYEFEFVSERRFLRPNETALVKYKGGIYQDGKYQINVDINLVDQEGVKLDHHTVDLYFQVERGRFKRSTYEELFLQRDVLDKEIGDSFSILEDDGKIEKSKDYQVRLPDVQRMVEMDPKAIYKIPFDSFGPNGPCSDNGCPNCPSCEGNGGGQDQAPIRSLKNYNEPELRTFSDVPTKGVIQASGVFNYKGMDNLLHPAFGWRVRGWKKVAGFWVNVAEDWIQWDGRWHLTLPDLPGETRFQYVAFNRFYTILTSSDDTYRWVGPIHDSLPAVHNEGSWFADTSSGGARGLGEIYREGMILWSKLYWEGSINPLRGSAIKVYFPNTTYDCGDGTGVPWSCAARDGRIWLIPSHASRNGVMQHELSHQINYEYWGNSVPSGAGGPHNLSSCYNTGLAEMEGFANFMVFWAQSGRGDDPSSGFDFRVEDPSFACSSNKATNESWVAAAFWDLHDQHGDGSDNLWFIHPGAVPAIYLRGGMKNGLNDYHPVYRNAANAEHRTIIDSIFRQNNIIN